MGAVCAFRVITKIMRTKIFLKQIEILKTWRKSEL